MLGGGTAVRWGHQTDVGFGGAEVRPQVADTQGTWLERQGSRCILRSHQAGCGADLPPKTCLPFPWPRPTTLPHHGPDKRIPPAALACGKPLGVGEMTPKDCPSPRVS